MKTSRLSGFTLIEILVVVSIIAILSVMLYAGFVDSLKASRDATRKTDLKQLQLAIESYRAQNGQYPEQGCDTGNFWSGPGPHSGIGANESDCSEWIIGLVPDFISELPTDPASEMNENSGFLYNVGGSSSDRNTYKVLLYQSVESDEINSFGEDFARCPFDCSAVTASFCNDVPPRTSYAAYSVGGECY